MQKTELTRVLVFGETGVGKTSLCNVLAGRSRPTDNGAQGVTAKTHVYGKFEHEGRHIELVDTVGLHEADSGTVPADVAVQQLVELLKHSRDGFSLLIHVAKAGRLTKDQEQDYEFFVNKMTNGSIPVILVLTGCENEDPMDAWVQRNGMHFARFGYRDLIATCFASGGPLDEHYAPLRSHSKAAVLSSVTTRALPAPVLLYGPETGRTVGDMLRSLWNDFVEMTGLPAEYRAKTNESIHRLMRRIGVPKPIADAAIKHIPELAEELLNKTPIPFAGKAAKAALTKILQRILAKPS